MLNPNLFECVVTMTGNLTLIPHQTFLSPALRQSHALAELNVHLFIKEN